MEKMEDVLKRCQYGKQDTNMSDEELDLYINKTLKLAISSLAEMGYISQTYYMDIQIVLKDMISKPDGIKEQNDYLKHIIYMIQFQRSIDDEMSCMYDDLSCKNSYNPFKTGRKPLKTFRRLHHGGKKKKSKKLQRGGEGEIKKKEENKEEGEKLSRKKNVMLILNDKNFDKQHPTVLDSDIIHKSFEYYFGGEGNDNIKNANLIKTLYDKDEDGRKKYDLYMLIFLTQFYDSKSNNDGFKNELQPVKFKADEMIKENNKFINAFEMEGKNLFVGFRTEDGGKTVDKLQPVFFHCEKHIEFSEKIDGKETIKYEGFYWMFEKDGTKRFWVGLWVNALPFMEEEQLRKSDKHPKIHKPGEADECYIFDWSNNVSNSVTNALVNIGGAITAVAGGVFAAEATEATDEVGDERRREERRGGKKKTRRRKSKKRKSKKI
jgi:hypothetical protein